MPEFSQNLKELVKKGIEVISSGAENLASSTRQKVTEFNLANEKEDLFQDIGGKVYDLWKQGIEFPDSLTEELKKVAETEEALNILHRETSPEYSDTEPADSDEAVYDDIHVLEPVQAAEGQNPVSEEFAAMNDQDVPVIEVGNDNDVNKDAEDAEKCPLSSAINDLFENIPPVDKMVDRVNSSLDDLGESLKKFSGDFNRQLNEFTDQIMGKDDKEPKKNV